MAIRTARPARPIIAGVQLPKRLSSRKSQRWIAAHNPFTEDSPAALAFKIAYHNDQADQWNRRSKRSMQVALIFLSISVVAQLVALVLRLLGHA